MTDESFCPYDICVKINKLGFKYYSPYAYYDINHIDAPIRTDSLGKYILNREIPALLFEEAKRWFLKKYGLNVDVISAFSGEFDSNNNKLLYFWKPSIEKITFKDNNLFTIDRMIDLFTDVVFYSKYDANVKAFEKAITLAEKM